MHHTWEVYVSQCPVIRFSAEKDDERDRYPLNVDYNGIMLVVQLASRNTLVSLRPVLRRWPMTFQSAFRSFAGWSKRMTTSEAIARPG